jgi:2-hydroxychromene-2-carboxylate isomerase
MLLGAVHKAVGVQAPIETKPQASYQARDIRRWAEYYGLPLEFPEPFSFRTLKAMRAAIFFWERGELEAFTREAFALYWEEGGAPEGREEADEEGPISSVAGRIGADPEEVLQEAASQEAKQALKDANSEAVERGPSESRRP